jgi:hypothetical protein
LSIKSFYHGKKNKKAKKLLELLLKVIQLFNRDKKYEKTFLTAINFIITNEPL